ncbi:MAG: sensor domain-containing diguanylate cyclase [Eubacteriales bacterium]
MENLHNTFLKTLDCIPNPILLFEKKGTLHFCNQSMLHFWNCDSILQLQENLSYYFKKLQIKNKNIFENITFAIKETLTSGSYDATFDLCNHKEECYTMLVNATTYKTPSSKLMVLFTLTNISNVIKKTRTERDFSFNNIPISFETICEVNPLALNLWTPQVENILCNQRAATLFNLDSKQQYLDDFFKLSPEYQPNGILSSELALRHINYAFKVGHITFYWLHCTLDGTEIPCEITLSRVTSSEDIDYVLGFTRDLRNEFDESDDESDYYFHNKYSDRKLFNTIVELSSEWFFVLDLRTDVIQYYGNLIYNHFGTYRISKPVTNAMEDGFIHHDDSSLYKQLIDNFKSGRNSDIELRVLQKNGTYRYYKLIYRIICSTDSSPVFAVGKGLDIHDQKQLEARSQLDLLSQCYNKVSGEYLMKEKLDSYDKITHCALLMIDIDDFKVINDNLGHLVGDGVIKDIADQLRSIFRKNDIVSRAGGDEFMVFMDDIADIAIIEKKADAIAAQCRLTYKGNYKNYNVSTSIGISCSIDVGTSYEELYKAADKALYQSKAKGKNCHSTYVATLMDTTNHMINIDSINRAVSTYLDHDLISSMFELLYQDYDSAQVMDQVLGYIGEKYQADRCYIIETFDEGITYTNTYEWCSYGTPSGMVDLQNTPAVFFAELFSRARSRLVYSNRLDEALFDKQDVFYIMSKQGIQSFAHAHVKKDDYVSFFIGLDDCSSNRVWTQRELSTLRYIGKITSLFLRGNTTRENLPDH